MRGLHLLSFLLGLSLSLGGARVAGSSARGDPDAVGPKLRLMMQEREDDIRKTAARLKRYAGAGTEETLANDRVIVRIQTSLMEELDELNLQRDILAGFIADRTLPDREALVRHAENLLNRIGETAANKDRAAEGLARAPAESRDSELMRYDGLLKRLQAEKRVIGELLQRTEAPAARADAASPPQKEKAGVP
jgi:hypothetical protein